MENTNYISDIRADDLFIEADMLEDCDTDPFPSKPNPNFPDIDFDEHEGHIPPDFPEGDPWEDGEPCLFPTWLD